MGESVDNKFMRRCLELASKAEGMTYPNPLVGAVIVHENRIIGEGYHHKAGFPHAEVNAINSVMDKSMLEESTLYVNLEPCSHFGKTPPCADLIISYSIPEVVIGTVDTSSKVSGSGIRKLKDAGCMVRTGILEKECRRINRRFFTYNEKRRPYIILKWAQSADGFIDILRSSDHIPRPTWISGKPERVLVHKWRATEQAILVGAGTIRADNPRLNVREWKGSNPLRIVLSRSGKLNEDYDVCKNDADLVVFTDNPESVTLRADIQKLDNKKPACIQISEYLYEKEIQSLFIEGGAEVFRHFIENNLWDEARIFLGTEYFSDGVKAAELSGILDSEDIYSGSILQVYLKNNEFSV